MKPGIAFGDFITTEKVPKRRKHRDEFDPSSFSMRGYVLLILAVLAFGVLLFRLVVLQVADGSYYRLLSDSNRIRTLTIHAPRGVIFDRNGIPLVLNIPGFRRVQNGKTTLLSHDEALASIAASDRNIEVDSLRQYPYKESLAHVIGYIGQISPEELRTKAFSQYLPTDLVGRMGIEQEYESMLKGQDGKVLVEVDALNKPLRILGKTDPTSGRNITLTLDVTVQEAAYKAMKSVKKGAVVASTPQGEILALVSVPSFDPNLFTMGEDYNVATDAAYRTLSDVLTDTDGQPLLDRAIAGQYPPGSTFKIVTAAAGLEDRKIDDRYTVEDTGILHVGTFSFANWYYTQHGKTDGQVNVVTALKRSNDIFFYKLAEKVGVNALSATASEFGVGRITGIDLVGEQKGTLPTPDWKKKVIGEPWYLGDTYHYGIGQGYLLTTPLQVNQWTQIVADGGYWNKPHVLRGRYSPSLLRRDRLLSDATIAPIRQGMIEACEPGGVAWPLFNVTVTNQELRSKIDGKNFLEPTVATGSAGMKDKNQVKVSVACKTGTAQHGDDDTLPHAWITLHAPAYAPQIVVTVLSESSGEGSNMAAPIARKVLEAFFTEK